MVCGISIDMGCMKKTIKSVSTCIIKTNIHLNSSIHCQNHRNWWNKRCYNSCPFPSFMIQHLQLKKKTLQSALANTTAELIKKKGNMQANHTSTDLSLYKIITFRVICQIPGEYLPSDWVNYPSSIALSF